jgi:hypothetical protein
MELVLLRAQTWERPLGRKLLCLAGLIIAALALAGCDTCGNFEKLNLPSIPKSCHANSVPG